MTESLPTNEQDPRPVSDDARKFRPRQTDSLFELPIASDKAYRMTTYWTNVDQATESKLVVKEYDDGRKEYLSITKVTHPDGQRDSTKEPIASQHDFDDRLWQYDRDTLPVSQKRRHEFKFSQQGHDYEGKADYFENGLCLIEVDAESKDPTVREMFDVAEFAASVGYTDGFVEVSHEDRYTGHHIVETTATSRWQD